jgi:hypothetical protein
MPLVTYPAALPGPSRWVAVPLERRAASSLPGPTALRSRSRDAVHDVEAEWRYSAAEMAIWRTWYEDETLEGQRWFTASAPGAGGWVDRVLKYRPRTLKREALGNGNFRVSVQLQQRGQAVAPRYSTDSGWVDRDLPSAAAWQYVAWSEALGIFCVVATGSVCATSPDGVTWTARAMPSSALWSRIVWAAELGLFVAVGYNSNKAATSPDGITWTARTLPAASLWAGLAWNGSTLVLIDNASSQRVLTSADGSSWTAHATALPSTASWDGLVWCAELGLFCTVASFSTKAATSPDGTTWTARTLPANSYWREIAWSGELAVVTDYDTGGNSCLTSPDLVNWTERALPVSAKWGSVCWNTTREQFCMVGHGAQSLMSTDGITWTTDPMDSDLDWYAVVWGEGAGCFVALANEVTAVANQRFYD